MSELPHDLLSLEEVNDSAINRSPKSINILSMVAIVVGLISICICCFTFYAILRLPNNQDNAMEISRINEQLTQLSQSISEKAGAAELIAVGNIAKKSAAECAEIMQIDIKNRIPRQDEEISVLRSRLDDLSVRIQDYKKTIKAPVVRAITKSHPVSVTKKIAPAPSITLYSIRSTEYMRGVSIIDRGTVSPLLMEGDTWRGVKIKSIGGGESLVLINGTEHRLAL